jgi:hypothetical protein
MQKGITIFLMILLTQLLFSCDETEKTTRPELDYSCLQETLDLLEDLRANSEFGDVDDTYPYESMDILDKAVLDIQLAMSMAEADMFFLQFEIDNQCINAEKTIADFENSLQITLDPGTPAELKVFGIDQQGRIEFGAHPKYAGSESFTVETWMKYDEGFFESAIGDFIATFNNTADPYEGWMINFLGGNLRATIGMGPQSGRVLEFGSPYPTNYGEWNHIAMVWDESLEERQLKMYMNGELFFAKTNDIVDGAGELQSYVPNTENLNMWAFMEPTDNSRCMTGYMKKFRMWNTAKSMDDIVNLMNSDVTGAEDDIICAWDFTEMPEDIENMPDKTGKFTAKIVGKHKWFPVND